ncbi:hypothetical protein [Neobacillus sp. LXY-1]|uniref:UPF0738 family protein n=1 Tax=Neobacillus sp. LXY-1 TaxID=3379133 RepID=UPI003EE0689E
MKKRMEVLKANLTDIKLLLHGNGSLEGLVPAGQILVDSDHISFIYLMETDEEYTYISLNEQIWPDLKIAYEEKLPIWIEWNNQQIELVHFHDEFEFIINNIKGNHNYGDEMVTKVERIFWT